MIAASNDTLVVGLGSPFGDDQVGWRLVEAIRPQTAKQLILRKARSADDLLDWLGEAGRLVVCDASQGAGPVGSFHCWRWPAVEFQPLRSGGSHDLGLVNVLALAERLQQLPSNVTIWTIEGRLAVSTALPPNGSLSPEVAVAIPQVAALISEALGNA